MSADRLHVDAPITHPLTMLGTSRNRRNVGRVDSLGEATIWGVPPDMFMPAQSKARSLS